MSEEKDFFSGVGIEGAVVKGGGNYIRPGEHVLKIHAFKPFESQQGLGKCVALELDVVASKGKTEQLSHLGTEEAGFGVRTSPEHDFEERVSTTFRELDGRGQDTKTQLDNLVTVCVAIKESLRRGADKAKKVDTEGKEVDPVRDHFKSIGVDIDTKGMTGKELTAFGSESQPVQGVLIKCSARTIRTKKMEPFTQLLWQGTEQV